MANLSAEGFGKESSVRFKEVVTPHKISLLILVYEYCTMKLKQQTVIIPTVFGEVPDTQNQLTQKEMRNFMIETLKLLQSSDISLKEFLASQRSILNPQLMDTLTERLKEIYVGGIQPLSDFFDPLSKLLHDESQPVMTKNSVFGVFVRRMLVAYERLSFARLIRLYDEFRAYYEECTCVESADTSTEMDAMLSESMTELSAIDRDRPTCHDTNRSDPGRLDDNCADHNASSGGFYSKKQAEYFIVMQGFRMQYNENEAMPAKQLQEKIMEMIRTNPELAEAHFLSYLNSLRVNEFCTALHNLYHYFDRHTPINTDGQSKTRDEDVNRRFAALNLASLHYRFGHRREALAALDEAIQMAQESNDHVCLQHALGWLYRLGDEGTEETGNLLERSVVKTQEHSLPYLASLGVQAFARHNALSTAIPASIFEFLVKSDVLNCQYSQSGFMCVSCVHKAALWQMYGRRESFLMYNQLALNLETSDCGLYYIGELSCIALCNLAKLHADKGDWASVSELLNNARDLFPTHSRYAHIWMACEQKVHFRRAMHCGNWQAAGQAVQNLKAVDAAEADIREAEFRKDCGETTTALSICGDLLTQSCEGNKILPEFKCRVYLLIGQLHCETGNHASAISPILDCICLARSHHLVYTLALASCYMAFVQLHMSLPSQAVEVLDGHMTTVLTNGSLYDRARVTSLYAKCRLAESADSPREKRKSVLEFAVVSMEHTIAMYRTIDATIQLRNSYFYLALYHADLGQRRDRNEAAREFKKLDLQLTGLSPLIANFF